MKTLLLLGFICCLGLSAVAQVSKEAVQKQYEMYLTRYDGGERTPTFMREFVDFLVTQKKINDLEKVADEYLKLIPVDERYSGGYLDVFMIGVRDFQATSFRDLITHWEKCVKPDDRDLLGNKVETVYMHTLFQYGLKKEKFPEEVVSFMKKDLVQIHSPHVDYRLGLLALSIAAESGNIEEVISGFERTIHPKDSLLVESWSDALLMGNALNVVLENADKQQCERMIKLLKPFLRKGKFYLNSLHDSFNGKLMMFDC